MEGNDQGDDFDDFFDTPGRQDVHLPHEKQDKDKVSPRNSSSSSPTRSSTKRHDRRGSGSVDRRSVSSDSRSGTDYSSDSETDSESPSRNSRRRRSRSRSASSRSADSRSSRDSHTDYSGRRRNRRTSRSPSSGKSRSRSSSPKGHRRGHVSYQKDKRRDSSSSITSSSQSETEKSGKMSPRPRQPQRQAWTTDSGDRAASRRPQDRPKTAKRRSANGEEGRTRQRVRSPVDTDSDITDVSPISSPRNGSVNGHKSGPSSSGAKYSGSKPMFQAMPDDGSHGEMLPGGDSNALDLNILMKAVSELEKQERVKANTRRVMFEPTRPRPMEKSNYTFSNDDTHRIEAENKRLLQQIMREMHKRERSAVVKGPEITKVKQSTLTASAVNRRREQRRIENENLAFLKRLQKIKPTKGISRREQLQSYNTTILHGIPIASVHPSPAPSRAGSRTGRLSSASSLAGSLGPRTRSMTSIHSSVTASSMGTASRMSSRASSRPSSAKKRVAERPVWNDRWWVD